MSIEPATWADSPALRTVLARAYRDNPLMVWALPDAATREGACAAWLGPSVDRYLAGGRADVARLDGCVVGVAAWRLPDRPAVPGSLPAPDRVLALLVGPARAGEILAALGRAAAFAPKEPAAYLNYLAVAPEHQGRGIGRELLDVGVGQARRDGVGTYLATSDPRNLPFYERAGFSAVGGLDLGGPRLTVLHGP
ncbi:GNAT family N-acetyltransferase [Cellulomonas sp. McL0617]|uniref:GNAT family N-acetyltransferase n=1 Tax=Cellulomonas sp. McL0617 TaxID=3415675 RepID=UPI003CE7715E